jgi:phosphoribosyl-ATP pyrophosphohydrolase/phosphoribosyl-AMP cyclohydrolase
LAAKGNKEIAKKIAEEANEVAISAVSNDGRIAEEAADLMYHLLVLLKFNKLSFTDVEKVLGERNKSS